MLVTNGIATVLLVFHPYYRDGFEFSVQPDEVIERQGGHSRSTSRIFQVVAPLPLLPCAAANIRWNCKAPPGLTERPGRCGESGGKSAARHERCRPALAQICMSTTSRRSLRRRRNTPMLPALAVVDVSTPGSTGATRTCSITIRASPPTWSKIRT